MKSIVFVIAIPLVPLVGVISAVILIAGLYMDLVRWVLTKEDKG